MKTIFSISIFLLTILSVLSQDLKFHRITTEDGLSNDRHWCSKSILKDDHGFIWISTVDGLNRWNGYDVETFRTDPFDDKSIHSNFVTALTKSDDGDVWIGTVDKGLSRFDYQTETFKDMQFDTMVSEMPQINDLFFYNEEVWIGTAFSGLFKYNIPLDTFIHVQMGFDTSTNVPELGVLNSTITKDGNFAISSYNGIQYYDYKNKSFKFFPYPHGPLDTYGQAIEEDDQGRIWYGDYRTKTDLVILDPITGETERIFKEATVTALRKDRFGEMWLTTFEHPYTKSQNKLLRYDSLQEKIIYHSHDPFDVNSFPQSCASEMQFDDSDNLWFMTQAKGAGYTSLNPPIFEQVVHEVVHNVLNYNDSTILLSCEGSFKKYNTKTKELEILFNHEAIDGHNSAIPSMVDSKNRLWYSLSTTMFVKNLETGETITARCIGSERDLVEGEDGKVWTTPQLQYFDSSNLSRHTVNTLLEQKGFEPISNKESIDVCRLSDGRIASGHTSDGLYIYNHKDTTILHIDGKNFKPGQLSNSSISQIYESPSSGKVYLATLENLNIWDRKNNAFTYINPSDGIEGRIVSMIEDHQKRIWVLSASGLYRIENDKVVAKYGDKYNLNTAIDRVDNAMIMGPDNHIYFTTSEALFRFNPDRLIEINEPKDVVITDLFLKRKKIKPGKESDIDKSLMFNPKLSLNYNKRDLGFEFVSPFEKESEVEYHYRLLGYDDTWINNQEDRQLHFTNLDNGHYTLELKAKSSEGQWSKNITKYDFSILAPWYKKWWSYLLFAVIVCSILYGIYLYRINQILKYQHLRTKISSDLHDDVGTLLSSLAMQSEILSLDAPPEKVHTFNKFSALSREAMGRMRDTVWAIDSRKDNIMSLMDRMADHILDMRENTKLEIHFENIKSNLETRIPPDVRQNVYLIFKEALNNALKYSNGDQIWIKFQPSGKSIRLSIKDNGTVENIKTSGTGLSNMKMRAKRIGGQIEIKTHNGFEILLTVH